MLRREAPPESGAASGHAKRIRMSFGSRCLIHRDFVAAKRTFTLVRTGSASPKRRDKSIAWVILCASSRMQGAGNRPDGEYHRAQIRLTMIAIDSS